MENKKSAYDLQAEKFLNDTKTSLKCELSVPQKNPLWSQNGEHGVNWYITIENTKGSISFDFWDSIYNKEKDNKKADLRGWGVHYTKPSSYSILAGLYNTGFDTFEDFCSMFGYDTDSITANKTFKEVEQLNKKLLKIFTEKELEDLQNIQ